MSAPFTDIPADIAADDVARLHQIGYPQQLVRRMGPLAAFSIPFSVISLLTGPVTLFSFALVTGGPAALVWTWVGLGPPVLCVAFALAEICSAYPTSGALYFWAYQLAGRRKVFASWVTAWLNALGQVAGTAAAAYSAALFLGAFLATGWGITITPGRVLGLFATILLVCAVVNSLSVRLVAFLNEFSTLVHVGGALVISFALLALPTHHQSAGFVFGHFVNDTGFRSTAYVWLLAPLTIMFTMTGLDAPGHMAEETEQAARTAPRAIVRSVAWSWILGLLVILALLFAIQHYTTEADSAGTYAVAPAAIISDAIGGALGKLLVGWIILAQILCVNACITTMPRMFFAVGRDSVFPGSPYLHSVAGRRRVPMWALWASAALAFLFGLPAYWSTTLFLAVTSIAATGMFLSYAIPIALRLRAGRRFTPGPYRLRAPRLVGALAVGYVAIAAVLVCLPTTRPITISTFNYTPIVLVVTLLGVGCYFAYGTRHYRGPRRFTEQEIAVIEDGTV